MPLNKNEKSIYATAKIGPSKEAISAAEARNSIFKACFSTQSGQQVLTYLREKYLNKPVCVIDNIYYGYVREGQNSIIREIEEFIKGAK